MDEDQALYAQSVCIYSCCHIFVTLVHVKFFLEIEKIYIYNQNEITSIDVSHYESLEKEDS